MFKVGKKETIEWPVLVRIPQDGGKTLKAEFTAKFKLLAQQRLRDLLAGVGDGDADADLADEVLVGWEGVANEGGEPLTFSDEAKAALLDTTYVRAAVLEAFMGMARGRAAARKN